MRQSLVAYCEFVKEYPCIGVLGTLRCLVAYTCVILQVSLCQGNCSASTYFVYIFMRLPSSSCENFPTCTRRGNRQLASMCRTPGKFGSYSTTQCCRLLSRSLSQYRTNKCSRICSGFRRVIGSTVTKPTENVLYLSVCLEVSDDLIDNKFIRLGDAPI